jgi:threonine dehydrogenase-like Zn-dependent dehydrogenase
MKAAQYYGTGDVRVENATVPKPQEDELLVEVAWCGICGSDMKFYLSSTKAQNIGDS